MYSFEWDENKNRLNKKKHGITFEEAETVFWDEYGWLEYDEEHSAEEDRFKLIGSSIEGNVLLVVHCVRDGDVIRIISSRKANATEKKNYESFL